MQIEEAKEYLKKRNENYKSHKEEIDSVCSDIYGTNNVREYHKKQEAIEAELNNTITRKKYRQTKKTLKGQIRESNAVIDEMAGWINKIDSTIFCDKEKCDDNCKECVKEYFYKKARDNK